MSFELKSEYSRGPADARGGGYCRGHMELLEG